MAKNKLVRILASPTKDVEKTYGANGVLSRLFRKMLLDLNISIPRFSSLMQDYITDVAHRIPNNKKDQTSERGNLTKEFSKPQMTWKVFCKALRFLQITKINIAIEAYHGNGKITLHTTTVDFGDRSQTSEFFNNLEQPEEKEAQLYVQALDGELIDIPPDKTGEASWCATITERMYYGDGNDHDNNN